MVIPVYYSKMQYISRWLILTVLQFFYSSFKQKEKKELTVITYNLWNGFDDSSTNKIHAFCAMGAKAKYRCDGF